MASPLATTNWGTGPRRCLLLHGLGSNSAGWWRVAPEIAALGYTVVAADLRGHGTSPGAPPFDLPSLRDDVLGVGDEWDLVLGHSLGGSLAIAALDAVPDLAGRVLLMDPLVVMSGDLEPILASWARPFVATAADLMAENPRWDRGDAEAKALALRQAPASTLQAILRALHPLDLKAELTRVRVPTLIVGADPQMQPLVPPWFGEELGAANEQIDFVVIRGGSHSMHRDSFDPFWSAVQGFIEEGAGET